jgi:bifunctional UDP-N-acetylglucosamine pyrophosphorylase / glucosamine-1-phosphate N-acetyltransferase
MVGNHHIIGIVLAAGKGTRINSTQVNKVTLPFLGKPIITYAVDLLEGITDETVIVVGAYAESVTKALQGRQVTYAFQVEQLGTAHAAEVGLSQIKNKDSNCLVLVGYGDHMMFYKKQSINRLIDRHLKAGAVVSFLSTKYHNPDHLAWARIERDSQKNVLDLVEQKDATETQRKIKEVNPGFYCFNLDFLQKYLPLIEKSPVSGEYYLTDLIKLAVKDKQKVNVEMVRFREVGIGINRMDELTESQEIYQHFK